MEFALDEEEELTPVIDESLEPESFGETLKRNLKYIILALIGLLIITVTFIIWLQGEPEGR